MNFVALCREITQLTVKADVSLDLLPQRKQAVVQQRLLFLHAAARMAFPGIGNGGTGMMQRRSANGLNGCLLGATVCQIFLR